MHAKLGKSKDYLSVVIQPAYQYPANMSATESEKCNFVLKNSGGISFDLL